MEFVNPISQQFDIKQIVSEHVPFNNEFFKNYCIDFQAYPLNFPHQIRTVLGVDHGARWGPALDDNKVFMTSW